MKSFIQHFNIIIITNLSLFLLGLLFIQLDIITANSTFAHIIGYLLPFSILINSIFIFLSIKKNQLIFVEKNVINVLKVSVISCLIFFILVKIKFANPALAYTYIYIIFPYMFLLFFVFAFILIRKKELKKLKTISLKLVLWMLILIIGIYFNKYFRN